MVPTGVLARYGFSAPDPLHRVVVRAGARAEDEPDPCSPSQRVTARQRWMVVEEDGDGRGRGVGGHRPLQEPKEAGAGGSGGDRRPWASSMVPEMVRR